MSRKSIEFWCLSLRITIGILAGLSIYALFWAIPFPVFPSAEQVKSQRDYFSVITSISAVVLGAFYYFHKLSSERRERGLALAREKVEFLLAELRTYANTVEDICSRVATSPDELRSLRRKLVGTFDDVKLILSQRRNLGLSVDDMGDILELDSFVDNCASITEVTFEQHKTWDYTNELAEARDLLNRAKKVLYNRGSA